MSHYATSRAGTASPLVPIAWIAGGAVALWLIFSHGFVQYDTFYALVWGDQIASGESPDYDAPLAPTPHPLATLVGVLLSPLGDGAETAVMVIAFLSLAAVVYLVYRLGTEWFNPWVGALAAAIFITRQPLLDFGVRAYVDIPYLALLLWALLLETRSRRAGAPVLALLAIAGLLRPEAWLFAGAYLLYLVYGEMTEGEARATPPRGPVGRFVAFLHRRDGLMLTALAVAAPVTWVLFDLVFAGDPLHSLTGTQDTVEALDRDTGITGLVVDGPQRLGEVLREPVLLGAAVGIVLSFALRRDRARVGLAALALSLAAFSVLAIAGLAVLTRYLLPAAAILCIFCAAGVLGWVDLPRESRWRRKWALIGAGLLVVMLAFVPAQVERISDLRDSIEAQDQLGDDLRELADAGAFDGGCGPVTVPDERAIPFLALWLDVDPSDIRVAGETATGAVSPGYLLTARSQNAKDLFTLHPDAPPREAPPTTNAAPPVGSNDSWDVHEICSTKEDG
jgi:Dolichyl-phosphate-mannose-protein mannosyltransferase